MLPTLCQCHQNEFCMTVSTVLCAFLCTQPKGHHACVAWNGIEVFQWQFNSVTKMNFTSNSWAETLSETFTHSVSSVSQIIYSLLCLFLEEISQCFAWHILQFLSKLVYKTESPDKSSFLFWKASSRVNSQKTKQVLSAVSYLESWHLGSSLITPAIFWSQISRLFYLSETSNF